MRQLVGNFWDLFKYQWISPLGTKVILWPKIPKKINWSYKKSANLDTIVCMNAKFLQSDVFIKFERALMSILFISLKSISQLGSYLKKHPFFLFFTKMCQFILFFVPRSRKNHVKWYLGSQNRLNSIWNSNLKCFCISNVPLNLKTLTYLAHIRTRKFPFITNFTENMQSLTSICRNIYAWIGLIFIETTY